MDKEIICTKCGLTECVREGQGDGFYWCFNCDIMIYRPNCETEPGLETEFANLCIRGIVAEESGSEEDKKDAREAYEKFHRDNPTYFDDIK